MSQLNEKGWEVPDQTPVAIPAYIQKYDQRDSIKEMIRQALSQEAEHAGFETFEEADDFDVGDDFDPSSPYEEQFDPDTGASLWSAPYEADEPPASGDTPPSADPVQLPTGDTGQDPPQ
ncbi:MAG: hypothetical protein [Microviridae sp.]|nr:MAG: hypothetical protein [Microviridae sp.]